MYRSNFKPNRANNEPIKEINESKQIDAVEKETDLNQQQYLKEQFYRNDQQNETKFTSIQDSSKRNQLQELTQKYSTNQEPKTHTIPKYWNYNSGEFHSTQAASPRNKYSTGTISKDQVKNQFEENSVKRKLFYENNSPSSNSPQFNLKESKYDTLAFTFKKKIDDYPRLFSERGAQRTSSNSKVQYLKVNLSIAPQIQDHKQNNSHKLNLNNDMDQLSSIKKKLTFDSVSFKDGNPIIKQINEQIRRDQISTEQAQKDYKISRRNQSDMIKKKILESKSDLKRFYEVDSQNVQYEYRKAKFMDIFLGSKTLQHNIR